MKTRDLLRDTANRGADYLESLRSRPVRPGTTDEELRRTLMGPLPETGCEDAQVIDDLVRGSETGLLATSGPRFFGWVIGGTLPAALAADWMTSVWDQNAATYACSPAAAIVEEACGVWLKDLLGLPAESSFALVTGCQMAHVTALAAARYRLLAREQWDVGRQGLAGSPPLRVFTGEHHHETFARALRLLGVGTDAIECVELDREGRLDPQALRARLQATGAMPALVCLQAGDLNTGVFDNFEETCTVAHEHGAWVHVDGAFGLWAQTSARHAHLLRGIAMADSWATDGHKWLNLPYDCGYAFVRDREAHSASMSMYASYVIAGEGRDQTDWTPEWSRRARAFPTYAAIRALGRAGIGEMVERCCRLAARLVAEIGALENVEILHPPVINQGLLRFLSDKGDHDARTHAVIAAIQEEGTAWFGGVRWRGMEVMRVSVCNWQTSDEDVDETVAAVQRVLDGFESP